MGKESIINTMDGGGGLYAPCGVQERTGIRLPLSRDSNTGRTRHGCRLVDWKG